MFTPTPPIYRTYLYCSGMRLDLLDKACASEADAVTVDLEDSVPTFHKERARNQVAECLSKRKEIKPLFVKINPPSSPYGFLDVEALAGMPIAGFRVPKVNSPDEITELQRIACAKGFEGQLQLMLETARGIQCVDEIAKVSTYTSALIVGEEDLRNDLGCDRNELGYCLSRVVIASRAAELLPPIMSVWPFLTDMQGLETSATKGKRMGFWGRLCVHPSQVRTINEVFTPSTDELERAHYVLETFSRAEKMGQPAIKDRDGNYLSVWTKNQAERTISLANALSMGGNGALEPIMASATA